MYVSDIVAGLGRRWWAVLLGLAITAGLAAAAAMLVPLHYVTRSSMLLLPPQSTLETTSNPFLGLGGLEPAADVLSRALNEGAVHETIAPSDGPAEFTVARDASSSGPLLLIEVRDSTPERAEATLADVVAQAPLTLASLQNEVGVKQDELIQMVEVARDLVPAVDNKSMVRSLLVAIIGGLAATLFGTMFLDGWLTRRREHRAARAAGDERDVSGAAPAPTVGPVADTPRPEWGRIGDLDAPQDHPDDATQAEPSGEDRDASIDLKNDEPHRRGSTYRTGRDVPDPAAGPAQRRALRDSTELPDPPDDIDGGPVPEGFEPASSFDRGTRARRA